MTFYQLYGSGFLPPHKIQYVFHKVKISDHSKHSSSHDWSLHYLHHMCDMVILNPVVVANEVVGSTSRCSAIETKPVWISLFYQSLPFTFYRQTQLQQTHHPANMACDTWSWQKKKKRKKETSSNISSRNKLLLGRSEGASAHLSARTRLGPHQTPTMAASRQQSQRWPGPVWVVVASVVVVVVVLVGSVDGARDHYEGKTVHRRRLLVDGQLQRSHHPLPQAPRWQRSDRPNIIMIMTDDQDLLLGMGCVCDVVVTITTTPPPPPSTTTVKLMVGGKEGGCYWNHLSVCPCVLCGWVWNLNAFRESVLVYNIPFFAFLFQICEDVLYRHCAKCTAEMRFGMLLFVFIWWTVSELAL